MAKSKQESEHNTEFAVGGDTHMFGKQSASPDTPGNTGKTEKEAPGSKYAEGGKGKMFGFHGAVPATAGKTSAR
jgi:hypothetical protein